MPIYESIDSVSPESVERLEQKDARFDSGKRNASPSSALFGLRMSRAVSDLVTSRSRDFSGPSDGVVSDDGATGAKRGVSNSDEDEYVDMSSFLEPEEKKDNTVKDGK